MDLLRPGQTHKYKESTKWESDVNKCGLEGKDIQIDRKNAKYFMN
jgi:hypothetical protein